MCILIVKISINSIGMKCKVKSRSILVILVNLKVKYYFISKKWNSTSRNLIERSKRLKLLMKV